jgi:hypothetical protein
MPHNEVRICGSDPDTLLAYSTPVIVSIRDWRLGCLKYALTLLIMSYIFVWQLLGGTTYLSKEDPTGVVRFSIQQPTEDTTTGKKSCDPLDKNCKSVFKNMKELDYCTQANMSRPFRSFPCRFWDANQDATIFQSSAIFATRVTEYEQKNACNNTATECSYLWNNTKEPDTYFVADVESYTILFDHTVVAPANDITGNSRTMQGRLKSTNKALCDEFQKKGLADTDPADSNVCLIQPNSTNDGLDIINLETLLAADNTNLEMGSKLNNGHTVRYNGAIILVQIKYRNFDPWSFENPKVHKDTGKPMINYTYEVMAITESSAKYVNTVYTKYPVERTVTNRHGIRVVVLQTGQLAKFDPQAFLLTLTASLTLLAIANSVVDNLAMYVLPQKKLYKSFKYQVTPDFSDYLEELEEKKREGNSDRGSVLPSRGNENDRGSTGGGVEYSALA